MARRYASRFATLVIGLVALTGVLGFIVARFFDVIIGVHPDFSLGLVDTFQAGAKALFPVVFYWLFGAAAIAVLSALRLLPGKFISAPATWVVARANSWDPVATAVFIVFLGTASWVVVNFVVFRSITDALFALQANPSTPIDLSILGPAHRDLHLNHYYVSTALAMSLALAVWRWFPRLEHRAAVPSSVRMWKWGAASIVLAFVIWASMPRRIIWERFPLVTFDHRTGLVIGYAGDEMLVYSPDEPGRPRTRVRRDAPGFQESGEARFLFDRR